MTTWVTPSSTIRANSACRVGASGVVRVVGTGSRLMRVPVVPMSPTDFPAANSPASTR